MKPRNLRWFIFGAGVGLGLSLAVTSPSRPVGDRNFEAHPEAPRVEGSRDSRHSSRQPLLGAISAMEGGQAFVVWLTVDQV